MTTPTLAPVSTSSATTTKPVIVCIGGNDASGFAGLSIDSLCAHALGVHPCPVVTATTAQNPSRVTALNPCSAGNLKSQLDAISQLNIRAVKIGLIAEHSQVAVIAEFIRQLNVPVVLDPVMGSSSGSGFWHADMLAEISNTLIPLVSVLTPNIPEAQKLSDYVLSQTSTADQQDQVALSNTLLQLGCTAVMLKGGHHKDSSQQARDLFRDKHKAFWLDNSTIDTQHSRGTGCCLATAIAASFALGYSVYDAAVIAKMTVHQGLRLALGADTGAKSGIHTEAGSGHVAPKYFPSEQCDLPKLSHLGIEYSPKQVFSACESLAGTGPDALITDDNIPAEAGSTACEQQALGLYPVVDRASWLQRLLPLGVTTAQIRIKDLYGDALEAELIKAIEVGRQFNCRLFVNDYWQLAIKHRAYGVHLGQEDLDCADIAAIHDAGLRLGTSTHCHYEVARAHRYQPSYIAVGPVYSTTSKDMPWTPHGEQGFAYWRDTLHYPLVAIGGINKARALRLQQRGANCIAMISAITEAAEPEQVTQDFIALLKQNL